MIRAMRLWHSRTSLITGFCLAVIGGLALARRVPFWPGYGLTGLLAVAGWRRPGLRLVGLLAVGLCLGLWRGHTYMSLSARYPPYFGRSVQLQAIAQTDAIYSPQGGQLSFEVSQVRVVGGQTLPGKIKVEGRGVAMVYRGDLLQISGRLTPTRGSAQAKTSYATLLLVQRGHSWIDTWRRRFTSGLHSVLPEPAAPFGAGLLLGQRSTIPQETNDQLSVTGLTHLVAVSGYNLTIIIVAVRRLLGGRSKFQSTVTAGSLMALFVLTTGFSASIVRAALVSGLSLLAWYYGRRFKPWLLISLAAAVTAAWNPFYLWSDIGWYLSFLAFYGVLLIAPVLSRVVSRGKEPKTIGGLLAETSAAQMMTLPIIMYIFGRLSLIGLLANLLVVPLVPLAMLLTLMAGLAGMLQPVWGGWVAWPAKILLTYMLDITAVLSKVPRASVQKTISLPVMLLAYAAMVLGGAWATRRLAKSR